MKIVIDSCFEHVGFSVDRVVWYTVVALTVAHDQIEVFSHTPHGSVLSFQERVLEERVTQELGGGGVVDTFKLERSIGRFTTS